MAAEPQPKALTRKPLLLNKVEGSQEVVNMAAIVPKEDGVISVSEDRYRGAGAHRCCGAVTVICHLHHHSAVRQGPAMVVDHHHRRVMVEVTEMSCSGGPSPSLIRLDSTTGIRASVRVAVVQHGDVASGSRISSWRGSSLWQGLQLGVHLLFHRHVGQGSEWAGALLKLAGLE